MTFTVDWFSDHIPTWEEKVLPIVKKIEHPLYLEIGSHEGRSLIWMLENVPNMDATAIDPFPDELWEVFLGNINEKKLGGRVSIIRSLSSEALVKLPFHYDVIYIDGSHYAHDVMFDTVLSWQKLKKGGVMIWDDYGWLVGDDPINGPKSAVDAFLTCYRTQYKVLHIDYQFIVEKL